MTTKVTSEVAYTLYLPDDGVVPAGGGSLDLDLEAAFVAEAPRDGEAYVRINGEWVILPITINGLGEAIVAESTPVIQQDASYPDFSQVIASTGSSGSVTSDGGFFVASCGVDPGSFGNATARRLVPVPPGQALRSRISVIFGTPVANNLQIAGPGNSNDGLFFGYLGEDFGVFRVKPGEVPVYRLTITAGASGAGTASIVLNGAPPVVINFAGVLSAAETGREIEAGVFPNWYAAAAATSDGATFFVDFIGVGAFPTDLANFSYTSAVSSATFAELNKGIASDVIGSFIPQDNWDSQPDWGFDPAKLNSYQINFGRSGIGVAEYFIQKPTGEFFKVHEDKAPNRGVELSQRNARYRMSVGTFSLGSTTDVTIKGGLAYAAIDGRLVDNQPPMSETVRGFTADVGAERCILLLKIRREFLGIENLRVAVLRSVELANTTNNRSIASRIHINPVLSSIPLWTEIGDTSIVEYSKPGFVTPITVVSPGDIVVAGPLVGGDDRSVKQFRQEVEFLPGDIVAFTVRPDATTASASIVAEWFER